MNVFSGPIWPFLGKVLRDARIALVVVLEVIKAELVHVKQAWMLQYALVVFTSRWNAFPSKTPVHSLFMFSGHAAKGDARFSFKLPVFFALLQQKHDVLEYVVSCNKNTTF